MVVEGIGANAGISPKHKAQTIQNVLPGLLHSPLAVRLLLLHKTQRVEGEKAGVLPISIGHPLIHPGDTGLGVLKNGAVFWLMENLAPDALHGRPHQLGLGAEIVVDRPHRHAAGGGHRAHIQRRNPLLPDQFPAGAEDFFFGCDHCVHLITSI